MSNTQTVTEGQPAQGPRVRVGIAGWVFPPWRGTFYPPKLPQKSELEYASRALSTIELNGSFYSLQRPESYAKWHDQTPHDFAFSVKAPRYVTHILKLRNVEVPIANFLASGLANLGDKLGPVLWQLAPTLVFDTELLEAFLALLPRTAAQGEELALRHDAKVAGRAVTRFHTTRPLRHAIEVRNPSFADSALIPLLRKYSVALVIADSAGKWPEYEDVTADFMYLRLHGADETVHPQGYTDEQLDRISARIEQWHRGGEPDDARRLGAPAAASASMRDVYCYFDNTLKAEAPHNARRLQAKVDARLARG